MNKNIKFIDNMIQEFYFDDCKGKAETYLSETYWIPNNQEFDSENNCRILKITEGDEFEIVDNPDLIYYIRSSRSEWHEQCVSEETYILEGCPDYEYYEYYKYAPIEGCPMNWTPTEIEPDNTIIKDKNEGITQQESITQEDTKTELNYNIIVLILAAVLIFWIRTHYRYKKKK